MALDGSKGIATIADTDAGQYDSDAKYDRAVGPMQFIPSTWSVVGVDADSDSQRNPQDIDDSALATAVYLCSGDDDLAGEEGQRAAVYRYNHSQSYVDLVLSIMQAYLDGDFTSVPNTTTASAGFFVPDPTPAGHGNGHGNGTATTAVATTTAAATAGAATAAVAAPAAACPPTTRPLRSTRTPAAVAAACPACPPCPVVAGAAEAAAAPRPSRTS